MTIKIFKPGKTNKFYFISIMVFAAIILLGILSGNIINTANADTVTQSNYDQARKWAIVIGVDRFNDRRAYRELPYAVADARRFEQMLISAGYDQDKIILFTSDMDQDNPHFPTSINIRNELESLTTAPPGMFDSIIFYFNGHGLADSNGENRLITYNTDSRNLAATSLAVSDIAGYLDQTGSSVNYMFLEACRSTATGHGISVQGTSPDLTTFSAPQGTYIIMAAQHGSQSYDHEGYQSGQFTYTVINALSGEADRNTEYGNNDGFISYNELTEYITMELWDLGRTQGQNQQPEFLPASPPENSIVIKSVGSSVSFEELSSEIVIENRIEQPVEQPAGPLNISDSNNIADDVTDNPNFNPQQLNLGQIGRFTLSHGDIDWFQFNVQSSGVYSIQTMGSTDTYIYLFGPNNSGVYITENDDGGTDYCSMISMNLNPGTYYVAVEHYDENGEGDYEIQVGLNNGPVSQQEEPNNSYDQATRINVNSGPRNMSFQFQNDTDWITFTLDQRANIIINTLGDADTVITLYGPNNPGNYLAENDDLSSGNFNSRISQTLNAGSYWVRITEYNGEIKNYSIEVRTGSGGQIGSSSMEPNNTPNQANILYPDGAAIEQRFDNDNDEDWVRFTISYTQHVVIQTFGAADTVITLYGPDNYSLYITDDDDSGDDYCSKIEAYLNPGTYWVHIREYSHDNAVSYSISVDLQ